MTETAEKRLKVLSDLDTLGAGFQLASHDLDIRGAGNLLGDEQSGHIKEVGFELYQSMLEEAIMEAKAGGMRAIAPRDFSPQITVDAPILIPEDYVPDLDLRMGLYRRLNELEDKRRHRSLRRRADRPLRPAARPDREPAPLIEIKLNAKKACIAKIDVGPRGALVTLPRRQAAQHRRACSPMSSGSDGVAKLRPDSKLVINRAWGDPKARLNGALQLSKGLAKAMA